jgi:uncharacterized damage-inducible protein DinB
MTEAWLRGPIPGIDPLLMPAAHALTQARDELAGAVEGLSAEEVWARPGGVAAIGFHLRHLAGSTDRLRSYARGEMLTEEQMAVLKREGEPGDPAAGVAELLAGAQAAIDAALAQIAATPRESLLEARGVGRKQLPTTVLGLLFHIAEHAARHVGQMVTTAKIVRAGGS